MLRLRAGVLARIVYVSYRRSDGLVEFYVGDPEKCQLGDGNSKLKQDWLYDVDEAGLPALLALLGLILGQSFEEVAMPPGHRLFLRSDTHAWRTSQDRQDAVFDARVSVLFSQAMRKGDSPKH